MLNVQRDLDKHKLFSTTSSFIENCSNITRYEIVTKRKKASEMQH